MFLTYSSYSEGWVSRYFLNEERSFFFDEDGRLIGEVYMGARSGSEWETVINSILESMK